MAKSTNGTEPVMMTPKEVSEYTDRKVPAIKKALHNPKYAHIFNDDAVKITQFPGYDPIVQINKDAIDRYMAEVARGGNRSPRSSAGRLFRVRVQDADLDKANAALAAINPVYVLTRPETRPARKPRVVSEPTATFEHTLVEV